MAFFRLPAHDHSYGITDLEVVVFLFFFSSSLLFYGSCRFLFLHLLFLLRPSQPPSTDYDTDMSGVTIEPAPKEAYRYNFENTVSVMEMEAQTIVSGQDEASAEDSPEDSPEDSSEDFPKGSHLECLPNEILEMVIKSLDLSSMKNLRLTSNRMAKKCEGPTFTSFFNDITSELTETGVASTLALASHPVFGPAVKNLTLLVVFNDESRMALAYRMSRRHFYELDDMRESAGQASDRALGDLDEFNRISQNNTESTIWLVNAAHLKLTELFQRLGSLDSLTLNTRTIQNIEVLGADGPPTDTPRLQSLKRLIPEGNWQGLWTRCGYALRSAMFALANSDMEVETLSLFDGTALPSESHPNPISGKVQSSILSQVTRDMGSKSRWWANPPKHLTLGFSTLTSPHEIPPMRDPYAHDWQQDPDDMDRDLLCWPLDCDDPAARDLSGPGDFLSLLAPDIESLDLRMYSTLSGVPSSADSYNVLSGAALTNLRHLTLRGLWTREMDLVHLIETNAALLETVDLRGIRLAPWRPGTLVLDSWDGVFDALTEAKRRPGSRLRALRLESLQGPGHRLVNLEPVDPKFEQDARRGIGWSWETESHDTLVFAREIGMAELEHGLEFKRLRKWRARDSQELRWRLEHKRRMYGPPDSDFDFRE